MHRLGLTFILAASISLSLGCSSLPQPQPVSSPLPHRLAAATPIPSPTSTPIPDVAILDIRGKTLGSTNAVIAHAPPGDTCTLDYVPPTGPSPPLETFNPEVADAKGEVRWVWTLSPATPVGLATITVTCGDKSVTSTFFVEIPAIE